MPAPLWLEKLKERWQVNSIAQVLIILVVFACTGFSVLYLKRFALSFFIDRGFDPTWVRVIYYILLLPIYNVILLAYGFLFGQSKFFLNFVRRMIHFFLPKSKNPKA